MDKDTAFGVHDGTDQILFFATDGFTGAVFGDVLVQGNGEFGIGYPVTPATQREVISGPAQSSYDVRMLMDADGFVTTELLGYGFVPDSYQLDPTQGFSFWIGSDNPTENYRIVSASIQVTGTTIPEPGTIALFSLGLLGLVLQRRG